jgi:YbgC/YbaW family acyl-CoA thioester hydrolase
MVRFPLMTATQPNHRLLEGFPVAVEIPVLWGELDAYGHVNNTAYFRYFESVRMSYLERCGVLESYDRNRTGIILHSTECRFRSALHFPDSVLAGTRTVQMEDDRFLMSYAVVSRTADRVVAEGYATLVWFDYNARTKISLPQSVRNAIYELEGDSIPTTIDGFLTSMTNQIAAILEDDDAILDLLANSHRIAVLGIKPESHATKPAFQVPKTLQEKGYEIVPVPVYFPEVDEILGEKVYRKIADIPGDVDILDVFRRPDDIPAHLQDILAKHPKAVWFQLGIRNDEAAKILADAGITVVQNRCMKIEALNLEER